MSNLKHFRPAPESDVQPALRGLGKTDAGEWYRFPLVGVACRKEPFKAECCKDAFSPDAEVPSREAMARWLVKEVCRYSCKLLVVGAGDGLFGCCFPEQWCAYDGRPQARQWLLSKSKFFDPDGSIPRNVDGVFLHNEYLSRSLDWFRFFSAVPDHGVLITEDTFHKLLMDKDLRTSRRTVFTLDGLLFFAKKCNLVPISTLKTPSDSDFIVLRRNMVL